MVYIFASGGVLERPGLYAGTLLLTIVLGALATAATVFLVSETYLGNSISGGEAIQRATKFLWRLILLTMAMSLVIGLGLIIFLLPGILTSSYTLVGLAIIPGVIVALVIFTGLLVSTQALVLEDASPTTALSRSWHLTRGFRWKMLGLVIVVGIIIAIPALALSFLQGGSMATKAAGQFSSADIAWEIVAQFVSTLIYPLLYCALTVAYYDLRVRKEGFDLELLESTLAHALPSSGPADLRELPKPPSY
jgi:hypothetical protein